MAILKLKLVEAIEAKQYLKEAVTITLPKLSELTQQQINTLNLSKDSDKNITQSLEDIIRESQDLDQITALVKLLDIKSDAQPAITRSIIKYRSIDPKINPIIKIYSNFDSNISGDDLFTFYNILSKTPMSNDDIDKYFNSSTEILESSDLRYLITLVAHLSDRYTAKKYKNSDGDVPSIKTHLMDGGKFKKDANDIKKLMDTFTTEASNVDKIDLQDWFENNKIRPEDQRNFLLELINNQKIDKPDNFDAAKLGDYIKNLYLPVNAQTRAFLMLKVKLRKDSSKDDLKELSSIIDQLNNALSYSAKSDIGFSINDILENNGATTFTEKITLLQKLVDKFDGKPASKVSAKYKLNQLKDKKNENLYIQLMNTQLPDADIDSLSRALEKFLKEKINQNYLYTTIAEAMALSGKQPAQGHKFLAHYLFNMKSDAKSGYLDKFDKVWNDEKLQTQLLNSRITKTANGFSWVKAITDFLNDIKI